jgi:hypothetical protein
VAPGLLSAKTRCGVLPLGGIFDLCGYIGNLRLLAATRANASNNSRRMSKLIRLPGARSSVISNEREQARERMDRLESCALAPVTMPTFFPLPDLPFSDDPAALDLGVGAARESERRPASIDSPAARRFSRRTFP